MRTLSQAAPLNNVGLIGNDNNKFYSEEVGNKNNYKVIKLKLLLTGYHQCWPPMINNCTVEYKSTRFLMFLSFDTARFYDIMIL